MSTKQTTEEWLASQPPEIQRIVAEGIKYIERMRSLNATDGDGMLVVPFHCYGCNQPRDDFCMMTGDDVPMCRMCFDRCTGNVTKITAAKPQRDGE